MNLCQANTVFINAISIHYYNKKINPQTIKKSLKNKPCFNKKSFKKVLNPYHSFPVWPQMTTFALCGNVNANRS